MLALWSRAVFSVTHRTAPAHHNHIQRHARFSFLLSAHRSDSDGQLSTDRKIRNKQWQLEEQVECPGGGVGGGHRRFVSSLRYINTQQTSVSHLARLDT